MPWNGTTKTYSLHALKLGLKATRRMRNRLWSNRLFGVRQGASCSCSRLDIGPPPRSVLQCHRPRALDRRGSQDRPPRTAADAVFRLDSSSVQIIPKIRSATARTGFAARGPRAGPRHEFFQPSDPDGADGFGSTKRAALSDIEQSPYAVWNIGFNRKCLVYDVGEWFKPWRSLEILA